MSIISHILIGCPSSGKSTLANHIIKQNSNYQIISTDNIRKQLFGDENIQGDWQLIEAEIFKQIDSYIQGGKPIIYDATNAKRWWRISLLEKLGQYLGQYEDIGGKPRYAQNRTPMSRNHDIYI